MNAPRSETPGLLVHETLAQGYLLYAAAVVVGLAADLAYPVRFSFAFQSFAAVALMLAGTVLVYWAQRASGRTAVRRQGGETQAVCADNFCVGPYVFTRSPTQYGLALLVAGLAVLYGMTFLLAAGVIAFLVGKFVIIRKEERHLAEKYGEPYLEYKKKVKL